MGFIPENIIDEIQARLDIVELISSYFPLKRAGRNFKALCPFHKEKTPSFIVSPDKQIFHCFGCGEGGNAIQFLMRFEKIDFPEAVNILARKTGVVIPEAKLERKKGPDLAKINYLAMQFYHDFLLNSDEAHLARLYLKKRGLDEGAISKFKLGYAPKEGWRLLEYLKKKGFYIESLEKSGLILPRGNSGGYFDFFRHRIIFPIFDIRARVVGFGGRVLDESLPKYINTRETELYKKGELLYGLHLGRSSIREKGFAMVVEGYMDLITVSNSGFTNVVATLGTALTEPQARLLKRYSPLVLILYDADKAGEMASLRNLELLLEEGLEVKIVVLATGFDPDSFIRVKGEEAFAQRVEAAKDLLEYKLELLTRDYDSITLEGKVKIAKEMLPTISKLQNAITKREFIKTLAEKISVAEESLWIELNKVSQSRTEFRQKISDLAPDGGESTFPIMGSIRMAEAILVKLMFEDKAFIHKAKQCLHREDFLSSEIKKIVDLLFSFVEQGKDIEPSKLVNYLQDDSTTRLISKLLLEEGFFEDHQKIFVECVEKIKQDNRRKLCQRISDEIKEAQEKGDFRCVEKLLVEFNTQIKQKLNDGV